MSIAPLPVHMSCFGVSTEAVGMARGASKASQSYGERLATVRAAVNYSVNTVMPTVAPAQPKASGAQVPGVRPAGCTSPGRQPPQVKLQPLGAAPAANSGPGPHAQTATGGAPQLLTYHAHSKHIKAIQPSLQAVDFASIADSSVGGGGVPRPYGKFRACRAGDGNATFQRLPPQPGTWQAKALPVAVTVVTGDATGPSGEGGGGYGSDSSAAYRGGSQDGEARSVSAAARGHGLHRSGELEASGSGRSRCGGSSGAGTAGTSRGRGYAHLKGLVPATYPGPQHTPGTGVNSTAGGVRQQQEQQSYYRRPGSSMHRLLVPLPPPEPHNPHAWFALPAATFLTDMPTVPQNLRLDNGYSISREHLMSGLHPGRQQQQHSTAASLASMTPIASEMSHGQFLSPHQEQAGPPDVNLGSKQELWQALERSGHGSPTQLHTPGIGPMGLRGVYVPLDNSAAVQQANEAQAGALGSLGAISGMGLAAAILPPEQTLPRKAVPPGW